MSLRCTVALHLELPVQPEKYGIKMKVDIYIGYIRVGSLMTGLKMEGILKWGGGGSRGLLYQKLCPSVYCPNTLKSAHRMYNLALVILLYKYNEPVFGKLINDSTPDYYSNSNKSKICLDTNLSPGNY